MGRSSPALAGALLTLAAVFAALFAAVPRQTVPAFEIRLQRGDFLHLAVDQRGVDVVATLLDPSGRKILAADGPTGSAGPEPVFAVAESAGVHRLEVRPLDGGAAGMYPVRIEALRPATPDDRVRAVAAKAFARGEGLRAVPDKALAAYREALRGWRRLGAVREEAVTLRRIGQASVQALDLRGAAGSYAAAAARFRRLGDAVEEGRVLSELGAVYRRLADFGRAEEACRQALALALARRDRRAQALALNNLGVLYDSRAEPRQALAAYGRALAAWQELGDRPREAAALHNLGMAHALLGEPPQALGFLGRALRLHRAAGDRQGEAATLAGIAWARELAGNPRQALVLYDRAFRLYRASGDRHGEAMALGRRGAALATLGRLDEASASFDRALGILRRAGARADEAYLLTAVGWLHEKRGDPARALEACGRALRLFEQAGDRQGKALALLGLARAERDRGRADRAVLLVDRALSLVESLRGETPGPALRTSYLASRYEHYETAIDLRMRLGDPGRALEASEQARARTLLEGLGRNGAPLTPLRLREVQRLLDPGTLLLEYALGEERSFLWVVGPGSLSAHELPGRAAIEERARRVHDLLSRSRLRGVQGQAALAAADLARIVLGPVLGPVAGRPGARRLVIVADGALQYVPFAALPVPGEGVPLLVDHEVVHLPSASILALQRRELAGRRPAPRALAVVADPGEAKDLPRLPHSREEAEAILSLVPPGESLRALGFDASRETVLSGRLSGYRILHFATHGVVDSARPERSGVVLRDGLLRVGEIRGLRLPAELVVLSACRTALGREVRGEGLTGLTHGFFRAGAERLVVSLWSVDDEATAELMSRFYRGMLREGLPASRALREAQLSLLPEPRWQAPYYWASFTFQGEWR